MDCTISYSEYDDFHLCFVETRRGCCSFGVPDELAMLVLTDATDDEIATAVWAWTRVERPDVYDWARGKQLRYTTSPPAPPPLRVVH